MTRRTHAFTQPHPCCTAGEYKVTLEKRETRVCGLTVGSVRSLLTRRLLARGSCRWLADAAIPSRLINVEHQARNRSRITN